MQIGSHGVRIHDILFPNSLRPKSKYIFLYCSIRRWIFEILKKLKILQTTSYFGQIVSKKDKLTIHIFRKIPKITILSWVLIFTFMYLFDFNLLNKQKCLKSLVFVEKCPINAKSRAWTP